MVTRDQPARREWLATGDPGRLATGADIPAEQDAFVVGLDGQHAGAFIAVTGPRLVPDAERHPIPGPGVPGHAWRGAERFRQALGLTAEHPIDDQPAPYRQGTAGVIEMGVAYQHQVQPGHPEAAQGRHHHPLADIEVALARSRIVEERVLAGPHQHRQPLPHIQYTDLRLAGLGTGQRREQHGQ
ncbi:hypothetical protein D9M68_730820 [compost metagenome]